MTISRINHPEDIPNIFGALKILSHDTIEKEQSNLVARPEADCLSADNDTPTEHEVAPCKTPQILTTKENRAAYQTNNWAKINEIAQTSEKALKPLYSNIASKGDDAWTKVKSSNGNEFCMTWNDEAAIWAYTESITPSNEAQLTENPKTTYQAVVQIGTYVKSKTILGLHSYNFGIASLIGTSIASLLVARTISTFIAEGLGFTTASFAARMTSIAARIGIRNTVFRIAARALSALGSCILFAVVFVGISLLWDWLNRLYTVQIQILNWDNSDWTVGEHYESNAKIPGDEAYGPDFNKKIPKMVSAGSVVTPPDFGPIKTLDSICYYALIVYQNNSTFMEGCDAVINVKCSDYTDSQNQGFTYGISVPRFKDNKHAISNGIHNGQSFIKDESQWKSEKGVSTHWNGKQITASLKDLSGAKDNFYDVIININNKPVGN
ncbi:hypothetical protein CYY_009595 [Polysphondylium violaceum]|uniref:Uncharacterized protein n=1 Tax=Polysphondylium violaceum TaxID=133409 RepID=A0A8J4PL34_9MYCE|nr:hypothetical protein CYY_009595 [Polysphondylium violaceum]